MYPSETACSRFLEKRGPVAGLTVAAVVVPFMLNGLRSEVTAGVCRRAGGQSQDR